MIAISYTLRIVALGAALIGFVSGVLSVFFVSRRQSILGDAIAHASLAGITIAFLLVLEKLKLVLILGALISGLLAMLLIHIITTYSSIKSDAAIGIVLSLFFGLGIALLSLIQKLPTAAQAGLKHYLFGNIAFLKAGDLLILAGLSLLVLVTVLVFWKELKLITFDPEYARTIGIAVDTYELLLVLLVVLTTVIGVELIGVVMMAGLLLAPALAARLWSNSFASVVLIAGGIGALAGVSGAVASANISNLPPGPTIIVILGVIVVFSIIFSKRGVLANSLLYLSYYLRYDVEAKIMHLADHMWLNPAKCDIREFNINPDHDDFPASMHRTVIDDDHKLYDDLHVLIRLGYVRPREGGTWILTHRGMEAVDQLNQEVNL